jgi:xylulose-5-phosphate/fructose-6-phosphate phosphoketolase
MSASPHANGGLLLPDLTLPDFRGYAVEVNKPGDGTSEPSRVLGSWLRDVITANPETFRLFGPDETASNRLGGVFEVTDRAFDGTIVPGDDHLAPDGRVMEVLSEHLCQGWLEGYLLTGRHGLFNCYEAFTFPHFRTEAARIGNGTFQPEIAGQGGSMGRLGETHAGRGG